MAPAAIAIWMFKMMNAQYMMNGLRQAAFCFLVALGGLGTLPGTTTSAHAGVILDEEIIGGRLLVAEQGEVTAYFRGSYAGYFNTLYLEGTETPIFSKYTAMNTGISLGEFAAGTELLFRLDVRDTGHSFYTGDAVRNPDQLAHAMAVTTFDEAMQTYVTTVGFEDLLGGGDFDYNDFNFMLTNVVDPVVPSPSVLALFGIGLLALGPALNRRTTRG